MSNNSALRRKIRAVVVRPMTYPEIEADVGVQDGMALGLELTRMVISGALYYKDPFAYKTCWPLYSNEPIPRGVACPPRKTSDSDSQGQE